ncbi:MAG: type II toxin-antitoxin system VapC family toxin [Pseudomonadota bacterium]
MRVVDTSAWIEWLIDSPTGKQLAAELPAEANWLVPSVVQLELSKWLTRELGEARADQIIAFSMTCVVINLDSRIALLAADLYREHGLSTADAIIYATARDQGAELITCDAHFKDLPGVRYHAKNIWLMEP